MAFALAALWEGRRKILPLLLLAVWIYSAGALRFLPMHHRDDYRGAAALAKEALQQGKRVWWNADTQTGEYYGLNFRPESALTAWYNSPEADLEQAPLPDLLILGKPDIYDIFGTMANYAKKHGFEPCATLTAFTLFKRVNTP